MMKRWLVVLVVLVVLVLTLTPLSASQTSPLKGGMVAQAQAAEMSFVYAQKAGWTQMQAGQALPMLLEVQAQHGAIVPGWSGDAKGVSVTTFTVPAGMGARVSGSVLCWNNAPARCVVRARQEGMEGSWYVLAEIPVWNGGHAAALEYALPVSEVDVTWHIEALQTGGSPWLGAVAVAIYGE